MHVPCSCRGDGEVVAGDSVSVSQWCRRISWKTIHPNKKHFSNMQARKVRLPIPVPGKDSHVFQIPLCISPASPCFTMLLEDVVIWQGSSPSPSPSWKTSTKQPPHSILVPTEKKSQQAQVTMVQVFVRFLRLHQDWSMTRPNIRTVLDCFRQLQLFGALLVQEVHSCIPGVKVFLTGVFSNQWEVCQVWCHKSVICERSVQTDGFSTFVLLKVSFAVQLASPSRRTYLGGVGSVLTLFAVAVCHGVVIWDFTAHSIVRNFM